MKTRFHWFLFIFFTVGYQLSAQQIDFSVSIDSTHAKIGQHLKLRLISKSPENFNVQFPAFVDTLNDKIEIIRIGGLDSIKDVDRLILTQTIAITSFDTGFQHIPPLILVSIDNTGDTLLFTSEAILVHFSGVEVDTSQAIKDIKGPLGAPYTLRELLPFIGMGVLAIALVIGILFLIRYLRRKKTPGSVFSKPSEPAYITALRDLEKLKSEKLWEKGEVKTYYIRLTDALRTYIENGLSVPAVEMVSEEIISALLSKSKNKEDLIHELETLLQTADLVKFAKASPLSNVHENCMTIAVEFVKQTRPINELKSQNDETISA